MSPDERTKAFNASSSALGRAVAKRAEVYVTPIPGGREHASAALCRFDERKKPPNGGQTKQAEIQMTRA